MQDTFRETAQYKPSSESSIANWKKADSGIGRPIYRLFTPPHPPVRILSTSDYSILRVFQACPNDLLQLHITPMRLRRDQEIILDLHAIVVRFLPKSSVRKRSKKRDYAEGNLGFREMNSEANCEQCAAGGQSD